MGRHTPVLYTSKYAKYFFFSRYCNLYSILCFKFKQYGCSFAVNYRGYLMIEKEKVFKYLCTWQQRGPQCGFISTSLAIKSV